MSDRLRKIVEYILITEKMTNLRLQKILYFIQAFSLISTGRPLFKEDILAWQYGPVVKEVYDEYKQWKSMKIPMPIFYSDTLDDEERNIIKKVLSGLEKYSTAELVNMTHSYDTWKKTYIMNENNIISKGEIQKYHANRLQCGRAPF